MYGKLLPAISRVSHNDATETPGPGDESFDEGILAHLPALHRLAIRLTCRPYDAEDLVQETVARALAYRAQFHPGTNLRSWLLTIERSIILNSYRSVYRAPQLQSMDNLDENTLYSMSGVSGSPSAESVLLHEQIDDKVVDTLRTLPEHYRRAVLLCDVQGLSYAEIAQQMGCALGTVMSRLHRGRALLRQALTELHRQSSAAVTLPTRTGQPVTDAA
jgi:RNA polymerase sigma-70 factor (ECF subfamily)